MTEEIITPKKNNSLLIVIVIILVVLAGLAVVAYFLLTKSWLGKWQSYENSRFQFNLEYPTNWKLGQAPSNNDGREMISPDNQTTCYAFGFANALTNNLGQPQSLDEYINWTKNSNAEEYLSQQETKLDQNRAIYLESRDGNIYADSIYSLGKENGIGLVCTYQNSAAKQKYQEIFKHMQESFKINLNLDGEKATETSSCHNLINRLAAPLKDQQTFTDTEYTEVTTTSREGWDQTRLPTKVLELQEQKYTCTPAPADYQNQESEGDVLSQPAVTKVEWSCDLEYSDWQYLETSDPKVETLKDDDYSCDKEDCLDDSGNLSSVYLCTK